MSSLCCQEQKAASRTAHAAFGMTRRLQKGFLRMQDQTDGPAHEFQSRRYPRYTVALAGNPNTGKSTLFNALTGLCQHTGNWPGKTVTTAEGTCFHRDVPFLIVDLPGTYSLLANSPEEEVARDFMCFGGADALVVVADATCLERNLNLVLQVMEMTPRVVVCVNLIDEARRKGMHVDVRGLSSMLGVPVIPTAARTGDGLGDLMDAVEAVAGGRVKTAPLHVTYSADIEAAIRSLEPHLEKSLRGIGAAVSARWVALRLIDGDPDLVRTIYERMTVTRSYVARPHDTTRRAVARSEAPA